MHYELFTKSFYGKAVELAIVFNPVDMPSEKETAEVAKIWSDVDSNYISAGVMSAEEVRDVRRSQDDSPYSALADEMEDAPDEELNQAADEALDGGVGSGNFNHAGRLGKVGGSAEKGVENSVKHKRQKAKLGVKQDLRGKRISRQELGTIKTDLFKNYNEEEAVKDDEYTCKTAKYRYIIRINENGNLANFSPLFRWRIK